MRDPLIPLCQIIADKLREHPQADPTALVAYLREAMAAAPDLAAAIQTDPRVIQINQGDTTAFQTLVTGGIANIGGIHLHEVDTTTLTRVLERFLREQPFSTIPQNLPRSGAVAFVGRAQDLARLHQQLHQSDCLAITAIAGMGGIGKTELALRYAQAHWQQGTYAGGVCWLQARQVALDAHISLDVGTQIVQFGVPGVVALIPSWA